jgi:hypothetical protein
MVDAARINKSETGGNMDSTSNMTVVDVMEISTPWDQASVPANGDETLSSRALSTTDQEIKDLETRAKFYQEKLLNEGFRAAAPVWDEKTQTWDVHVKYDGLTVLVMVELKDPEFVRVMLPAFFEVEQDDLGPTLIALDLVNKHTKGAKVFLTPQRNGVYASCDFLDEGTIAPHLLVRHIAMVVHAAHRFVKAYEEQAAGVR